MKAAVVLGLLCYLIVEVAQAGKCDANGPEISLSELHEGCTDSKKSRSDKCVAAMHDFCKEVTYGQDEEHMDTLGISQKHASGKIFMSCVKSEWSGWVPMAELQEHEKGCTVEKGGGQSRHCLAATHRFCKARLNSPDSAAGISQKVNDLFDAFYVQCFKSPRKGLVRHDVLSGKKYQRSCDSDSGPFRGYHSHTDDCFEAASEWCQENLGRESGGITQEADEKGVVVACYEAEFSNWAHIAS